VQLDSRAVRWDASGTAATELELLGLFFNSEGTAINNAGVVVGWVSKYDSSGEYKGNRAVRWDAWGTVVTELDNLGTGASGGTWTRANDINATGTAVGYAEKHDAGVSKGYRAVRWDASGTAATELGVLGFSGNFDVTESYAVAINDAGAAVGYTSKYDGSGVYMGERAVRWDASGTAAIELGNLGTDASGYTETNIYAINDAGIAVGYADDYDDSGTNLGERAVFWGLNGDAVDLNTLIDPVSGWTLTQAHAISNTGWIGGSGLFDPDGAGGQESYARLFLLQLPAPNVLPGDYNSDNIVDAVDYTVWRDRLGQSITLANEHPAAATPGVVDAEDYAFWTANFGQTGGAGAAAHLAPGDSPGANYAVPEPATFALIGFGVAALMFTVRCRRSGLCRSICEGLPARGSSRRPVGRFREWRSARG
jgi:hypothetical protein